MYFLRLSDTEKITTTQQYCVYTLKLVVYDIYKY